MNIIIRHVLMLERSFIHLLIVWSSHTVISAEVLTSHHTQEGKDSQVFVGGARKII